MKPLSMRSRDVVAAIALAVVALGARLAVLPYATTDGSNSVARVWNTLQWLDDPGLITHGVWGPLHYYLIAAVLVPTGDQIMAPILLHVLIGVAAVVLFYVFVRLEFAGPNCALLVGLAYALYPVLLRASVAVRAEAPFVLFVLGCMVLLSLARRHDQAVSWAAAAGLAMTLASMLRYEGWMLTPLLALMLWPRFVPMAAFLAVSALHPVFWMIGNAVAYGDPFYFISYAQDWELESMGRSDLGLGERLRAAIGFVVEVARGLTPLVAMLAFAGGIIALVRDRRAAPWLVPPVGLLALMLWSVFNGSLVPKSSYTVTAGTLALPFAALALNALGAERLRAAAMVLAATATIGLVAVGSCEQCFRAMGLQALRGTSPIPGFENEAAAVELSEIVAARLGDPPAGVISDFYGHSGTTWGLLLARTHPDRIFLSPWGPYQPLDEAGLAAFAQAHPQGLLLLRPGSRFTGQIALDPARGVADLAGHPVVLEQVASVAWPQNDWRPLAPDDVGEERVVVFRYAAAEAGSGASH